jgi:dihydrofolate reductase
VRLFIAASLDGFVAREDGSVDWLFHDADYGYTAFYEGVDAVIMGRKTYDEGRKLGASFRDKRAYVFTRTARPATDDATYVTDDPAAFTRELVTQDGKDIWLVGGGEIIKPLAEANLIDDLLLFVHPIVLGGGIPLFPAGTSLSLRLVSTEAFPSGLVRLEYATVSRR